MTLNKKTLQKKKKNSNQLVTACCFDYNIVN